MSLDLSDYDKTSLHWDEATEVIVGEQPDFPKYTTQLLNIANQNAQGTRPKVVGQMSELIQQCPDKSFEGWRSWYLEKKPGAIERAVRKIMPMLENFREALGLIDEDMVRSWVKDLVITKTAEGLVIQEAILKKLAEDENTSWRLAAPEEESKNIDGYLGKRPVSIKPTTYLSKTSSVRESIQVEVIFYKKTAKYLHIYRPPK